ncbi:MAG: hypothetical protein JXA95_09870, partial [Spirochaetales bacterium]|nr:hypothetical protein [Spirochaetales bacterium]
MSIRSKTLLIFLVVLSILLAVILPYAINRTNKLRFLYLEDLAGRFKDEMDRAVSAKNDVWLTNALQIAKNPIIIDAMARGDREPAIRLLAEYSSDFKEYTNFKNVVVHLIDGENRSFVKSWDSVQFGESLSYSRAYPMVLNSGTPFVTMEESPKGLRLKGLFPVMKDNSLIGIVNYEGGLNSIKRDMEEKNLEFLYVLDESYLPIATSLKESPSVQGYRVSQKDINQDFVDFCALECDLETARSDYFFNKNYVVKAIPVLHENGEELGYYFMGQKTDIALEDFQVNMRFTQVIFLGMGLAIMVLLAVFMFFLEMNIIKPVRNFSNAFSQIAMGDLEQDINVSEKTYLGTLASSGKGMVESLRKFINGIQGSTLSIEKTFKVMVNVMNSSISEANRIASETNKTLREVTHLDESTAQADSAVNTVEKEIGILQERVEDQTSAISETTSAITQMTASIESIAHIAESRLSSTQELLRLTDNGSTQVQQTIILINDIGESIGSMQQMANIISEITEQTNLLAMNAAIEAAHAGELGKGFAVVAGEIRALAESTSKSSIQIGQTLSALSVKIAAAIDAGEKTESVFGLISESSHTVARAFESINMSTSELNVGSEEMVKASVLLRDIAND